MSTHHSALNKIYEEFGVTRQIIRGKSRKADLVDIRKIVTFVLTNSFGMRPAGVAALLSRDRTLVYHYIKDFENTLKTDHSLSTKYRRALHAIGE